MARRCGLAVGPSAEVEDLAAGRRGRRGGPRRRTPAGGRHPVRAGGGVEGRRGESSFEGVEGDGDDDGGAEAAGWGSRCRVGSRHSTNASPSTPVWASASACPSLGGGRSAAGDGVGEAGVGDGLQGGAEHVRCGSERDVEVGDAVAVVPVVNLVLASAAASSASSRLAESFGGVGVDDLQQPVAHDAEVGGVETLGLGEHHLLSPVSVGRLQVGGQLLDGPDDDLDLGGVDVAGQQRRSGCGEPGGEVAAVTDLAAGESVGDQGRCGTARRRCSPAPGRRPGCGPRAGRHGRAARAATPSTGP